MKAGTRRVARQKRQEFHTEIARQFIYAAHNGRFAHAVVEEGLQVWEKENKSRSGSVKKGLTQQSAHDGE